MTEIPAEITRSLIIDWNSKLIPGHVLTDRVTITNVETGQPILTATELHVHAHVRHMVVAELLTLADADGQPILDVPNAEINARMSVDDDGTLATATSWWHVSEMRVGT